MNGHEATKKHWEENPWREFRRGEIVQHKRSGHIYTVDGTERSVYCTYKMAPDWVLLVRKDERGCTHYAQATPEELEIVNQPQPKQKAV